MSKSSIFAKGVLATAAGAMALSTGAAAFAQPYSSYSSPAPVSAPPPAPYAGDYDPCQREANGRGIGGALIGGGMGAVVGSQMAASGHRTDGSVLGGVLGAVAGAVIGNKSAACNNPPPPAYAEAPPPPPPPVVYGSRFDGPPVFVYGRHGQRFRIADRPVGPDGCTLAESPIYMPDGEVQKRFVRVCPDATGRFQVVD
jgi:hypothetical protein